VFDVCFEVISKGDNEENLRHTFSGHNEKIASIK